MKERKERYAHGLSLLVVLLFSIFPSFPTRTYQKFLSQPFSSVAFFFLPSFLGGPALFLSFWPCTPNNSIISPSGRGSSFEGNYLLVCFFLLFGLLCAPFVEALLGVIRLEVGFPATAPLFFFSSPHRRCH